MRHLLNEREAADAQAAYYALQYDDARTRLVTYRPNAPRAIGYVCQSRTGYDLFRPIVTLRLPIHNPDESAAVLRHGLTPGAPVILSAPEAYMPLVGALFDLGREERYRVLVLDRGRYRPILNVLVTHETGPNGLAAYAIRHQGERIVSATVNWQTGQFADLNLSFNGGTRRAGWTESVLAALAGHMVDTGRTPLLTLPDQDDDVATAAQAVGFIDLGIREHVVEAMLRPPTT